MRHLTVVTFLAFSLPVGAQEATRAAHRDAAKIQTDSLLAETCRGGTLRGLRCYGATAAPRVTVLRRLTLRLAGLDSALVAPVPVPPSDTVTPPPVDTVTPPPVDTVPPPPPPATQGFVGPAELPRAVPTWPAGLATSACTVTVTSNLQMALDAAHAGDVLCLSGVFAGSYTLPARADSGWVVVRSLTSPVPPGTRVRPSHALQLSQLYTTAGGGAATLAAARGARGWYVRELELTIGTGVTATLGTIVHLPRGASEIVFDRVLIRAGAAQNVQRCVALNSASTAIVHSWLDECHAKGFDSQAIVSWESDGPVLLDDNTLAGAGENLMLGGADPATPGVVPQDWTITRNHIWTPVEWKGRWTKKNLFETKNARRILVEGNVLDGSWTDGQVGYAFVLKTANQSGACTWCSLNDVVIRRNLIVRAAGVFGITGREGSNTYRLDSLSRRLVIAENFADSIGLAPYTGAQQLVAVMQGVADMTITGNTLGGTGITNDLMVATPPTTAAVRLTFTRNVLTRGQYPLHGCGGPILGCLPGAVFSANVFAGPTFAAPAGITTAPTLADAITRAGSVSRGTIDAATAGVVVRP